MKSILKAYFTSWWLPLIILVSIYSIEIIEELLFSYDPISLILFFSYGISLLGIFIVSIYQLFTKQKLKSLINFLFFFIISIFIPIWGIFPLFKVNIKLFPQ